MAHLNEITFYDYSIKPTHVVTHANNVQSMELNENGKLLVLDDKNGLYLYSSTHQFIQVEKQVVDYRWGKQDVFCHCKGSTLCYQLYPFIQYNFAIKSLIQVKYQTNIEEIMEFDTKCILKMENGEIKASNAIKSYLYQYLDLLNTSQLQNALKVAMAFKHEYLYACLLQAALDQNNHELVLQCCAALKLDSQLYCLTNFNKQFAMELVKNNMDTSMLSELEQYRRELEAFQYARMLPMARKSVQHESLFAHYRKGYLAYLGQEEFIEEYKLLQVKTDIKDMLMNK
eukprot:NODE_216_length_14242_cov_0.417592.p6 type:complete len:286 gc:universal NODE_216_length_14242_cov_0.417592:9015-8158(-)